MDKGRRVCYSWVMELFEIMIDTGNLERLVERFAEVKGKLWE